MFILVDFEMKIILMRHGKPSLPKLGKMRGAEFINWINLYNAASLDSKYSPLHDSVLISKSCRAAVCSTLTRSIESADKLGLSSKVEVSDDFVEAGLPSFNVFNLKCSEHFWLLFFRVSWLLGYAPNSESYSQVRFRVKKCADQLIEIAKEKDSVILIGHGVLNRLISKELRARNWQGSSKAKSKYWQFSFYENEQQ